MLEWNDFGLQGVNKYIENLDQSEDAPGGLSLSSFDDNDSERFRNFCLEVRKCGLALIEKFLCDYPESNCAALGKMFILGRLERYQEVLQCAEDFQQTSKLRSLPVVLKKIDAWGELGRFDDAWKQIEQANDMCGRYEKGLADVDLGDADLAIVRLHVKEGEVSTATSFLAGLKIDGKIEEKQYEDCLKWIEEYGDRQKAEGPDSGVSDNVLSVDAADGACSVRQGGGIQQVMPAE